MDTDGRAPGSDPGGRRRARLLAVGLGCAGAVVIAVGAVLALDLSGDGDAGAQSPALVGPVASSSTTRSAPTPATLALSQPENPPDDERADVPVVEVGSIEIPRIGLSAPVYEGIWLTVLDVGPGHWPGTAGPGGYGNAVVAGHRVTHSAPFRRIDELVPGDTIVLADASGRHTYEVTGSDVVTPEAVDIVTQRPGYTVTLFACHPPGSAAYRYVVFGRLVSAPRPAV